jgi:hypothetical protein
MPRTTPFAIVDGWRVFVLETLKALREQQLTPREARAAVCDVLDPAQQPASAQCGIAASG